MIYYTGDIHGQKYEIERFCKRFKPTKDDTIVILGDVAANYSQDERDTELKQALNKLKPTILCIHGNHEIRPWNIPTYKTKKWNGGTVWYEEEYPSVLFARDGEIYALEGLRHIAIGGAYSVDKFYRIARGYGWWEDEQPPDEIRQYVEQQLKGNKIDVILSHTCPFKYEPVEVFLPGIDQSTVDTSTEKWLDAIEDTTDYIAWFCGHWHINKRIDKKAAPLGTAHRVGPNLGAGKRHSHCVFQKQRMRVLLCVLYSVILNLPTDFSPRLIKYGSYIGIDFSCEVM